MKPKNRVSVVIILANFLLFTLLFASWYLSKSVVVQAELYNVFVDLVYSFIIVSGFLLSRAKQKPKYPEGLIRLDPIISAFIGIFVIATGIYLIYNIVIIQPVPSSYNSIVIVFLFVSIIVKALLYKYVQGMAQQLNSNSLYATSVDQRNDIITHFGAVIGYLLSVYGYTSIETLIALAIAIYVFSSGLFIIKNNIPNILGYSVSESQRDDIVNAVLENENVHGVHDVEIHYTGTQIDVSMHLEVDGNHSLNEAHQIEISIADKIREQSKEPVNEINLHLDPKQLDEWK